MDMSLILEFVQEAREYIEEIEPTLIEISNGATEAGSVDSEMINSIFRLFHSMKGSAGFLALSTVVSVTHEAETLLDKIRNGKLSLTVQITATLCRALDLFRDMLNHIGDTGNDEGFDQPAQAMIAVLKKHVAGESVDDSMLDGLMSGSAVSDAAQQTGKEKSGGKKLEDEFANFTFDELANEPVRQPIPASELDFSTGTTIEEAKPALSPMAGQPTVEPPAVEPPTMSPPKAVPPKAVPPEDLAPSASSAAELSAMQLAPEMRHGFVLEATEQLDATEQALLLVLDEHSPHHAESLNDAFRNIHSFKGNCGFMGLVQMEHLSHTMETLLDGLRNNEIQPNEKNIGTLLNLLDVLGEGVTDLGDGGVGKIINLGAHIRDLSVLLGLEEASVSSSPPPAAGLPVSGSASSAAAPQEDDLDAQIAAAFAARDLANHEKQKQEAVVSAVSAIPGAAMIPAPAAAVSSSSGGNIAAPSASGQKTSAAKQDIRVDLHKLDLLINLVGELVIAESMVTRCPAVVHVEDEYYNRAKHQLRRICDDLQDCAMSVRMIPLSATFRKMIRLVHDLATKSGKKIKLNLVGEETEVDKTVIEQIADPLVHIVRNSCDHGVEPPEDRLKAGKPETGEVTLEGKHEGGEVWITITDDGRGLNRERIAAKAQERGLVGPEIKDWSDDRIYKLVFEPGFSTADKVTDISGRGVGMDVVKRNIEKLNGRIDIASRPGYGSTFTLRIPLTLAIVDAMLVRVGDGKYMIPTLTIRESLVPTMSQVTITPEGREILRLREEMVPIVRLYDVFGCRPGADKLKDGILIVAEDGGRSYAFFVDEIIGQQQTVIKGLPDYIGEANGFSGCTILGDGTVSLIVDVGAVSQMTGSFHASPVNKAAEWQEKMKKISADAFEASFADLEAVAGMTE